MFAHVLHKVLRFLLGEFKCVFLQHRRLITSVGGGGHLETMMGIFPTTFPRTIALKPLLLSGHSSPSRLPPLPTPHPTPTMHPTLFALSFPPQLPLSFIFCSSFSIRAAPPPPPEQCRPRSPSALFALWTGAWNMNKTPRKTHTCTHAGAGTGSPGNAAAAVAATTTTQAQPWTRASSQNSSTVFLTSGDVLVRTDSAGRDTN